MHKCVTYTQQLCTTACLKQPMSAYTPQMNTAELFAYDMDQSWSAIDMIHIAPDEEFANLTKNCHVCSSWSLLLLTTAT